MYPCSDLWFRYEPTITPALLTPLVWVSSAPGISTLVNLKVSFGASAAVAAAIVNGSMSAITHSINLSVFIGISLMVLGEMVSEVSA